MKKFRLSLLLVAVALMGLTIVNGADFGGFGGGGGFGGFGGGGGRGGFNRQATPPVPPCEVPEIVAIPRPTQEQVEKMNAELKKMIAASNLDVFKKFGSLVEVSVPRDNPCVRPTPGVRGSRHDAFVQEAENGDFDILFHGDSITDWWRQGGEGGGADVQAKYFGDVKVANFGVAGDTTQGILWGMQNGETKGHKPKAVMLMIGTNSIYSESAEEIAEGVGAVILQMRKDFPDAKILLLAIFPRGADNSDSIRDKIGDVNKIIAKLADNKNVFFKDINKGFLGENGKLIGFRSDNLHPNAEGYEIWAKAVADTLKGWVK